MQCAWNYQHLQIALKVSPMQLELVKLALAVKERNGKTKCSMLADAVVALNGIWVKSKSEHKRFFAPQKM